MPRQPPVDELNNALEEIVFASKNSNTFKKTSKQTHFNYREVEVLAIIHRKIKRKLGNMNRWIFRDVLHSGFDFTENIRHLLVDRIFNVIDKRNALQLNYEQWTENLSILLRGNLDEKIRFAYQVYDHMHTNKLKKDMIFPTMRGCLIKLSNDEDPDEAVKDLIDILFKKLDVDRDGSVSEEDFTKAVKERDLLLLESMGPVFPSRQAQNTFSTTFTNNYGRY